MNDLRFKRLIIVEGPAGVGKSTLLQKLMEASTQKSLYVSSSLEGVMGTRKPEGEDVYAWAYQNDTKKLNAAVNHLYRDPELDVAFMDRFMISQQVYGKLRQGGLEGLVDWPEARSGIIRMEMDKVHGRCMEIFRHLSFYHHDAVDQWPFIPVLHVHWVLLSANIEVLEKRRSSSEKAYPFGFLDGFMYTHLFYALRMEKPPKSCSFHFYQDDDLPSTIDDIILSQ